MRMVTRRVLEFIAASSLIALLVSPAVGSETMGKATASNPAEIWEYGGVSPALPPTAGLPWWADLEAGKTSKPNLLFGGKVETLGPFLLEPATRFTQSSFAWPGGPQSRTE